MAAKIGLQSYETQLKEAPWDCNTEWDRTNPQRFILSPDLNNWSYPCVELGFFNKRCSFELAMYVSLRQSCGFEGQVAKGFESDCGGKKGVGNSPRKNSISC